MTMPRCVSGADIVTLNSDVVVTGNIMLGAGNDTLDYGFQVNVTGTIDLGDDNDTLILRPAAVLPLAADLIPGPGTDTLQLGNSPTGGFNFGTVDLSDNNHFEMLVIGEVDSTTAVGWQISTSSQVQFSSGVLVHPRATMLVDGQVEIVTAAGRVLCVVALADTIGEAQQRAYALTKKIHWKDAFYRRDIGHRALER